MKDTPDFLLRPGIIHQGVCVCVSISVSSACLIHEYLQISIYLCIMICVYLVVLLTVNSEKPYKDTQ